MYPTFTSLIVLALGLLSSHTVTASLNDCTAHGETSIHFSLKSTNPGETIRIKAVSVDGPLSGMSLETDEGIQSLPIEAGEGPPYTLDATLEIPLSGHSRIIVFKDGTPVACKPFEIGHARGEDPHEWNQSMEAFYASWIAQLFDGPPEDELSFKSLEPVLRNPDRNFLYNFLGLDEDNRLPATPDCADLPYFLRGYFAWKLGLPLAYRACDRGTKGRAPHCGVATFDDRFSDQNTNAKEFTNFIRKLFDTVHSGSARTAISDESTDFYPLELSRKSLWPGSVYADPYGHTLIIAKWIAPTEGRPGILLAADAQPDNSVTRKRFWEGNFLFADLSSAGAGFKAFRPILREAGHLYQATNHQLAVGAPAGQFSLEQDHLPAEDFYAAMERAINPTGLEPIEAYEAKLSALIEQVQTRVTAVQNGDAYAKQHRGSLIAMPSGASIFQTTGPWEDFASPSRDMRLLIALNVVSGFPEQIRRHPELFHIEQGSAESIADGIAHRHDERIQAVTFSYVKSDGSSFRMSLKDLFERRRALEVGYNPNDCSERRWGAVVGTEEYESCSRQAPQDQFDRMEQYRSWFRNTQRPSQ